MQLKSLKFDSNAYFKNKVSYTNLRINKQIFSIFYVYRKMHMPDVIQQNYTYKICRSFIKIYRSYDINIIYTIYILPIKYNEIYICVYIYNIIWFSISGEYLYLYVYSNTIEKNNLHHYNFEQVFAKTWCFF